MKKYLGTIFLIFGFLEIIVLSAISTFDRVMYEDTNHFIGFIKNYGLWPFLIGSVCIFRKNRALAPHERSAVPLGTDHCPVG